MCSVPCQIYKIEGLICCFFFFSSRRRHTRCSRDWSSDVCSSDLAPTLPERDDFYEVGYVHRFPLGVVTKLSAYHKRSSPGIDDNTVPGSSIVTSVNIDQVRITGIEGVVEIRPKGPVSAYVNLALNHAYGYGAITGGFFPVVPPSGTFDLDHDQRLSGEIGRAHV